MKSIRNEILHQLKSRNISFQHLTHQEISQHRVAEEVGVDVREGVKCLILKGKKSHKNYLICVRGHQRVDMRAVAAVLGEACEFEKMDVVKERYGLEVGAIPPFGKLLNLEVYFDTSIQDCREVIFSCGLVSESIRMQLTDLIPLIQPKFVQLAKSSIS